VPDRARVVLLPLVARGARVFFAVVAAGSLVRLALEVVVFSADARFFTLPFRGVLVEISVVLDMDYQRGKSFKHVLKAF
jgi:hypothetical protein